jgi:transcriptional regulator with XRE-family HTH domain
MERRRARHGSTSTKAKSVGTRDGVLAAKEQATSSDGRTPRAKKTVARASAGADAVSPKRARAVSSRTPASREDASLDAAGPARAEKSADLDVKLGKTVRRMRSERGLSIQALARASGLSPGTIHKIENDAMVPSVTVLLKLARSLECAVGDLLAEDAEGAPREVAVFRADRRPVLTFAEAPVRVHPIVGKLTERMLEAGIFVVDPGARSSTEAIVHPGEKIYFVLSGTVRFVIDRRPLVLQTGDAVHLKAHLPHRWENASETRAELLFVLTPPLGSVTAVVAGAPVDGRQRR